MATMENYLKAKIEEVEKSKREVEFELFRLKQEGTIGLVAEMKAMTTAADAAVKEIDDKDTTIADLRKQLADEKKYSSDLKSTIESLKEAGTHKSSQMMNAQKTATTKHQAAKETIKKLQDELYEKSREVVKWRTEWKRAKVDNELLRGGIDEPAAGTKRKSDDAEGGAQKKHHAYAGSSSGDEDDEEPLMEQWARKTAAAAAGLANIKLEKEDD
ncbi:hypothetical protein PRZ48_004138 [Zasmidium cellare]|uniref:Uncharacterized protein n=1 Tax=Zasmidium cellare TaxID=395010 RepID=A0ABR0EYM4_ZASCE|nr:hypothetical protein PRZ48_004138 [Zasmidium cellare]